MIAVKLSKEIRTAHDAALFEDYVRWSERNLHPNAVFMVEECDAVHIGDAKALNVFMRWAPNHGEATSGYLCPLFFEFADPVDLDNFL